MTKPELPPLRAAFEAWYRIDRGSSNLRRAPSGDYWNETAHEYFQCWQEAYRAGLLRAAEICEAEQVNKSPDYYPGTIFDGACRTVARAIRAEADKEEQ